MTRVQEIILHKMTPTITFKDIFQKCRLQNAHPEITRRARECILNFFKHLKNQRAIKDFTVMKSGNSFYGIQFSYEKFKKSNLRKSLNFSLLWAKKNKYSSPRNFSISTMAALGLTPLAMIGNPLAEVRQFF